VNKPDCHSPGCTLSLIRKSKKGAACHYHATLSLVSEAETAPALLCISGAGPACSPPRRDRAGCTVPSSAGVPRSPPNDLIHVCERRFGHIICYRARDPGNALLRYLWAAKHACPPFRVTPRPCSPSSAGHHSKGTAFRLLLLSTSPSSFSLLLLSVRTNTRTRWLQQQPGFLRSQIPALQMGNYPKLQLETSCSLPSPKK